LYVSLESCIAKNFFFARWIFFLNQKMTGPESLSFAFL